MFVLNQKLEIKSYRGQVKGVKGTVVAVRDILAQPLTHETIRRNRILRSNILVTVEDAELASSGHKQYHSYYDTFVEVEQGSGNVVAKLANWLVEN